MLVARGLLVRLGVHRLIEIRSIGLEEEGFIPPGAKYLKGNKLSTSQVYIHLSKTNSNNNRIPSIFPFYTLSFYYIYYFTFRILIISS